MEAIMLGGFALGMIAWAWWSERKTDQVVQLGQELPIEKRVEEKVEEKNMGTDRFYQQEHKIIAKFFRDYDNLFRVTGITRTPRTIIYQLGKRSKTRISSLRPLIETLESKVYQHRNRSGYPEVISATWATQPLHVAFPRIDPDVLDWNDDMQWSPQKWRTHFAKHYVGTQAHNIEIDLDSTSGFSVLLGGTSGCGKSTLLDGFILNACKGSHPDELKLLFVDIGGKHFQRFWNLPHTYALATTDTEALELLQHIESELTGEEDDYSIRYLLVIDEIQRLTQHEKKAMREKFKRLLYFVSSMGRAYGYSFVYATQTPKASVIPTEIRDNCAVRIAGRCKRELQSESILGDKSSQAVGIPNFTFIVATEQNEAHAFTYLIADVEAEITASIEQYDGYESEALVLGESVPDEPDSDLVIDINGDIPAIVLDVFVEFDDGTSKMKAGWMTKAIQAYAQYVDMAWRGRNYDKFKAKVHEYLDLYQYINSTEYSQRLREGTSGKIIKMGWHRK